MSDASLFDRPVVRQVPDRGQLAERMASEARKAMLLDPRKLTPALDDAVESYLKATELGGSR